MTKNFPNFKMKSAPNPYETTNTFQSVEDFEVVADMVSSKTRDASAQYENKLEAVVRLGGRAR
jgi:hypothetical protein